ncbi:MAG: hypothetical protein QOF61_2768 [Acidobacteriota bacterium]|jgi:hypothetical protein|nr:hypothetical protein [Acidobacteriota bacterium]
MKSIACITILALSLLSVAPPRVSTAQTGRPSANGVYKFIMEDDLVKYVEFSASTDDKGTTTGSMTFTDEAKLQYQDVDGTGDRGDEPVPFSMTVSFDTLTVEKNRALMGGMVRDSSYKSYIGKWVQLVVEDNGTNIEVPDRLVWRLCQPEPGGWVPSDYEVPGDRGAYMSWWATDAEQKGDVGIPSKNLIPGNMKSCEVLSVWAYSFAALKRWDGDIQVIP